MTTPIDLRRRFFCFGAAASVIMPPPKSFFILEPPKLDLSPIAPPVFGVLPLDPSMQQLLDLVNMLDQQRIDLTAMPAWAAISKDQYDRLTEGTTHGNQARPRSV